MMYAATCTFNTDTSSGCWGAPSGASVNDISCWSTASKVNGQIWGIPRGQQCGGNGYTGSFTFCSECPCPAGGLPCVTGTTCKGSSAYKWCP